MSARHRIGRCARCEYAGDEHAADLARIAEEGEPGPRWRPVDAIWRLS